MERALRPQRTQLFKIGAVVYDQTFKVTGTITAVTYENEEWLYKHTGIDTNKWVKESNIVPDGSLSLKRAQWL